MRVTMDEVNDVIRNYYNKAHPEFILTKRIMDNLAPIVHKGLAQAPDVMQIEQASASIYGFLEKDSILDFIKTRQPCVMAIPKDVIDAVNSYFADTFPNMRVRHIYRKSNQPDDQYLYMITAVKEDGTYSCWSSWNSFSGALNHGHYNLGSEETGIEILRNLFNDITDEPEKYGMEACEYEENQIMEDEDEKQKNIETEQNNSDIVIVNRHRGR